MKQKSKSSSPADQKILRLISEKETIEKNLRDSEKKYRDLLEQLPVGVYRTTPDGKILEANIHLANLLGYDNPAELKNVNVAKFYKNKSDREEYLQKKASAPTTFFEVELKKKDGSIICVRDFHRVVLGVDDRVQSYTGILVDISEQRETERQLHRALVDLEMSNRERQTMIARLESLSLLDFVTKLYNRRGFLTEAEKRLEHASKNKIRVFFLFMDLDNLKWINDSWGHQKGDQALVQFAEILTKALRRTDVKGRLGGDEFAVLAEETPGFTSETLVNRIQKKIEEFNAKKDFPFQLSISMGIAHYDPDHPSSVDELMVRADKLMYEQKRIKHQRL